MELGLTHLIDQASAAHVGEVARSTPPPRRRPVISRSPTRRPRGPAAGPGHADQQAPQITGRRAHRRC